MPGIGAVGRRAGWHVRVRFMVRLLLTVLRLRHIVLQKDGSGISLTSARGCRPWEAVAVIAGSTWLTAVSLQTTMTEVNL